MKLASLPGFIPVLPKDPITRGKQLLDVTSKLIELRGKLRELEAERDRLVASFPMKRA